MQFTCKSYIAHTLLFNASRAIKNRAGKFEARDKVGIDQKVARARARLQDKRAMDIEDNK